MHLVSCQESSANFVFGVWSNCWRNPRMATCIPPQLLKLKKHEKMRKWSMWTWPLRKDDTQIRTLKHQRYLKKIRQSASLPVSQVGASGQGWWRQQQARLWWWRQARRCRCRYRRCDVMHRSDDVTSRNESRDSGRGIGFVKVWIKRNFCSKSSNLIVNCGPTVTMIELQPVPGKQDWARSDMVRNFVKKNIRDITLWRNF